MIIDLEVKELEDSVRTLAGLKVKVQEGFKLIDDDE